MGLPPGIPLPGGTPPQFPGGGGGSSGGGGGLGSIFTNPQNLILLGTSILSSLLNRPRGLSSQQQALQNSQISALQQLISTLSNRVNQPISVNPQERALLFGNIAETSAGAARRGETALAGRGLSRSGILGDYLSRVSQEQQRGQNAADLFLLNKATGEREADIGRLLAAAGLQQQPTQGTSAAGAVFGGLAPILAYLIRTQQLQQQAGGTGGNNSSNLLSLLPLLTSGGTGG